MANRTFIKVQTVVDNWNGSTYEKMLGDEIWIDPSVIVEVYPLKEAIIYKNRDERDHVPNLPKRKYACIYRSTIHGHGINGLSTDMMVDEASYNKICECLGLA